MKRRPTTSCWCLLFMNLLVAVPGLAEDLPKGRGQHCIDSEFEGGLIKARRPLFNKQQRENQQTELKKAFLRRFNSSLNYMKPCFPDEHNPTAELSCLHFLGDKHVHMKHLQKDNSYWWYPAVHHNQSDEELKNNFEKCNGYLGNLERNVPTTNNVDNCTDISCHLRYTLIPFLPWKCQVDNEFSRKIELLVYLYNIKNTLSRNCGDLICNITKIDTSITILSLNRATDQLCIETLNEINNSPSCYPESNEFCFYALKERNTRQSFVFISKDTDTISKNEKLVYILRNFTNFQGNGSCERPLDYTMKIMHFNKNQTYYFCSSRSNDNARDSWRIKDITESKFLVALNANVSVRTIESNVILQQLLSNRNNINTTVYNIILKSNYTFEHYTDAFNISVFNANPTEIKVLEDVIKQEKYVTITSTKYFTKVENNESIWGHLNWIIFHSCSHEYQKDDKGLFLFLYNGTLNLEYICNESTAVLLTSIRRENVTSLNSTNFVRGCFDQGISHNETSKDCKDNLQSGTDYETRFFHFLIYPRNIDKLSAINQADQIMKNPNETELFEKTFYQGSHPSVRGGFTKIVEIKPSEFDHKEQTISLQKTLQILIMASLSGNKKCLKTLKEGSFSIDINPNSTNDNLQPQPLYVIGPIPFDISNESCLTILPYDVYTDLNRIKENKKLRVNKFWPICMYNMLIAWDENTEGVVLEWDYLSPSCKAMETALFVFCCAITFITIFGNTIVITVIIFSRLIKKHVYMIYTSLAVADLLLGVTSASLALHDTYYLRSGQLTIYNFSDEGPWAPFGTLAHNQPKGFQQTRFPRHGWPGFCAVAMNISILSSLMSLALLGTDRLLMFLSILTLKDKKGNAYTDNQNDIQLHEQNNKNHNHNPIRFRDPFVNTRYTQITILIIWVWNIICAFLINTEANNNTLTGLFDPITKLTLNTGKGTSSVFYLQVIVASMAGIIIVTATVASAIIFNIHESKMQMNGITIHHPQRKEQVYVVTRTFIMMVILFLVSSVPVAVGILTNSLVLDFSNTAPTFHFVIWWLFMAGSSWNWIIYCFRGQLFKEKAKEFCQNLCGSL
ncbi:uncharacterized protein LOC135195025 [Macrobrachium nipponense]|uniref:uncharacterized protein LOC135195025 n=1 Tax=Macrobrachium nipponense TaxID=159736 RepID=UPI0030C8B08F